MQTKPNGFSLIELLVATAIIAVLMMVAIPSYQTYVERQRQQSAQQALLNLAGRQEQWFADSRAYYCVPSAASAAGTPFVLPADVAEHYNLVFTTYVGTPPTASGCNTGNGIPSFSLAAIPDTAGAMAGTEAFLVDPRRGNLIDADANGVPSAGDTSWD